MAFTLRPLPRDRGARGMVLEGTLCALLLAVLVGVCASWASLQAPATPRRATVSQAAPARQSVSTDAARAHEHGLGVHEPSRPGQLELPRPTRKPTPSASRFTPRHALVPGPQARLAVRPEPLQTWVTPEARGRVADRPLVVNCPAQGPPSRTA